MKMPAKASAIALAGFALACSGAQQAQKETQQEPVQEHVQASSEAAHLQKPAKLQQEAQSVQTEEQKEIAKEILAALEGKAPDDASYEEDSIAMAAEELSFIMSLPPWVASTREKSNMIAKIITTRGAWGFGVLDLAPARLTWYGKGVATYEELKRDVGCMPCGIDEVFTKLFENGETSRRINGIDERAYLAEMHEYVNREGHFPSDYEIENYISTVWLLHMTVTDYRLHNMDDAYKRMLFFLSRYALEPTQVPLDDLKILYTSDAPPSEMFPEILGTKGVESAPFSELAKKIMYGRITLDEYLAVFEATDQKLYEEARERALRMASIEATTALNSEPWSKHGKYEERLRELYVRAGPKTFDALLDRISLYTDNPDLRYGKVGTLREAAQQHGVEEDDPLEIMLSLYALDFNNHLKTGTQMDWRFGIDGLYDEILKTRPVWSEIP